MQLTLIKICRYSLLHSILIQGLASVFSKIIKIYFCVISDFFSITELPYHQQLDVFAVNGVEIFNHKSCTEYSQGEALESKFKNGKAHNLSVSSVICGFHQSPIALSENYKGVKVLRLICAKNIAHDNWTR